MDAWNRGDRPDVDDHLARVPEGERGELAEQLTTFLAFAPTPDYSEETLAQIRAEAPVAEALGAAGRRGGLLPSLLGRFRERLSLSTPELAASVVEELSLRPDQKQKAAGYLERLERGELEPARVSRRVFEALGRVFGVPPEELEGAGDIGRWGPRPAPVFRADGDAARVAGRHLEVLADALEAPGAGGRDEVDDLFLGGR